MKKENQKNSETTFRLAAKFADFILCPKNALDAEVFKQGEREFRVTTKDGRECVASFEAVWDNTDGLFDEDLEGYCQYSWGLAFRSIRSVWISRLGSVSDMWYLLRLRSV